MAKMNKILHILLLSLCLSMISCMKEKRETLYNNQEENIDKYITKNMYRKTTVDGKEKTDTLTVVYRGGSSRLVNKEGTGEELKADGTVSFYYAGYTFSSSKGTLFATNHQATGEKWAVTDPDYSPCVVDMRNTELIEGLRQGLIGVKSGEVCEILFSGKYAYGKKPLGIIPANSAVMFEIWVQAVSNE